MKNEQLANWHDVSAAVKRFVRADFSAADYQQGIYRLSFDTGVNILMSDVEMAALVKRYQEAKDAV